MISVALSACGADADGSGETLEMSDAECKAYPEKDIKFIVPFGAGGYDAWARAMAPYLKDELGGEAEVRVENQEGAGGLRGVNSLNNAKPDGYTILIFDPASTIAQQLVGNTAENLDARKIRYFGTATADREVLFTSIDSDLQTPADLEKLDPIKHAAMEPNPREVIFYNEVLDQPAEFIMHDATPDAVLALRRNDAHVARASLGSVASFLEGKEIKPLMYWGPGLPDEEYQDLYDFENVANLSDFGREDLSTAFEYRRTLAAPPGTPDCVVDALESALTNTLENPDFEKDAAKASMIVKPFDAADTTQYVTDTYEIYNKFKSELEAVLGDS